MIRSLLSKLLIDFACKVVNVQKKLEEERSDYETVIEANMREIETLDGKLVSLYEIERQVKPFKAKPD